jgi:hypothetical protein
VSIAVIARWVGHTQTRVTEMYWHASRQAEHEALQRLDRLDELELTELSLAGS